MNFCVVFFHMQSGHRRYYSHKIVYIIQTRNIIRIQIGVKYTICNLDMIVCVCVCDHIRFLFAYTMLCYVRCIRVNLWCDIANHRDSISCRVQVQIYVHIGPLAIRHGTNLNCRCVDCGVPCVLLWHIFFLSGWQQYWVVWHQNTEFSNFKSPEQEYPHQWIQFISDDSDHRQQCIRPGYE